jgi:hypothetical protein
MSKKHFKALAEAIAQIADTEERERTASLVGRVCADCNDRFDWYRWRSACGVERS